MLKINIPTPCHQDWNVMIPNTQGRHCNACVKTVVDFTAMTDDEVKYFFLTRKEDEKVCGRFRNEQLQRITIALPSNIFTIQMPLWKKYLAAILIVFSTTLFSCDTQLRGKAIVQPELRTTGAIIREPQKIDNKLSPSKPQIVTVEGTTVGAIEPPQIIQGDISIEPMQPIMETMGKPELIDSSQIITNNEMIGKVMFVEKDSANFKKDKVKDSISCDKKGYY
jgi:hypothetical protein